MHWEHGVLATGPPGTIWKEVPTAFSQWPGPSWSFRIPTLFFFKFLSLLLNYIKSIEGFFFCLFVCNFMVNMEISEK